MTNTTATTRATRRIARMETMDAMKARIETLDRKMRNAAILTPDALLGHLRATKALELHDLAKFNGLAIGYTGGLKHEFIESLDAYYTRCAH